MERVSAYLNMVRRFSSKDAKRYAVIEGNQDCNRSCSYCAVPSQYNPQKELTLAQTKGVVDWVKRQGFAYVSYLGGEPFAPFKTREGLTFSEHTLEVVKHAKEVGLIVNVTSNGDYLNPRLMRQASEAGLDTLVLSLHTYTYPSIDHLITVGKLAAQNRIIPAIQTVMTSETADKLPSIAAKAAQNGILFSVGLVQTVGDGFSREQDDSVIPTLEQQERVFGALRVLKRYGFTRNNANYLSDAPKYYPNNWTCNPDQDTFVKIGAGGKLNVCSRVETDLTVFNVKDLTDPKWRDQKREGVATCGNCLFNCYYEVENPNIRGDISTALLGLTIKLGGASFVEKWGKIILRKAYNKRGK